MEIIKPEAEEKKIYFRFPPSPPASHKVVELTGLSKSYDQLEVFDGLDLRIEKGDRIAVVGVNGAGKSTLFKIITGAEEPNSGQVSLGETVKLGYVDQSRDSLQGAKTVWEEILHSFLFSVFFFL